MFHALTPASREGWQNMWVLACVLQWVLGEASSQMLATIELNETDSAIRDVVNLTQLVLDKKFANQNSSVSVSAIDRSKMGPFFLDRGVLGVSRLLDREAVCGGGQDSGSGSSPTQKTGCSDTECCLLLGFQCIQANGRVSLSHFFVLVKIRDTNDNGPEFPSPLPRPYRRLSEASKPGKVLELPKAWDRDSQQHGVKAYQVRWLPPTQSSSRRLSSGSGDGSTELRFQTTATGRPQLVVVGALDYERRHAYELELLATDDKRPGQGYTGSVTLCIEISDENDNAPRFDRDHYVRQIQENARPDHLVEFLVSDLDSGHNSKVTVSLAHDTSNQIRKRFQVIEGDSSDSGSLRGYVGLVNALDYETDPHSYVFQLQARDQGMPELSALATVRVSLSNVNDNSPSMRFSGVVGPRGSSGSNSGGGQTSVFSISENLEPQTFVALIRVEDRDSDWRNIRCHLLTCQTLFHLKESQEKSSLLDFMSYQLVTQVSLDREAGPADTVGRSGAGCGGGGLLRVTVQCSDNDRTLPLLANQTLTVRVTDQNDHEPEFGRSASYRAEVAENEPAGQPLRFPGGTSPVARDRDVGKNAVLRYHLIEPATENVSSSSLFQCDSVSGRLVTRQPLDYESGNQYRLLLVATDQAQQPHHRRLAGTATVTVHVRDVNDNAPRFRKTQYNFQVAEDAPVGTVIGQVNADDDDTEPDNKVVIYELLQHRTAASHGRLVHVDQVTGVISSRHLLDRERVETILVTVRSRNRRPLSGSSKGATVAEAEVTVIVTDINDNKPRFSPSATSRGGRVEFIVEQFVEGNSCVELPYSVSDPDYSSGTSGSNGGCCNVSLEGDSDQLFSLLSEPPAFLCLARRPPARYQTRTLTLVATDRPPPPQASRTARVSFPVVIRTVPGAAGLGSGRKSYPDSHGTGGTLGNTYSGSGDLESRSGGHNSGGPSRNNFVIIAILVTVVLAFFVIVIVVIFIIRRCSIATDQEYDAAKCSSSQIIADPSSIAAAASVEHSLYERSRGKSLQSPATLGRPGHTQQQQQQHHHQPSSSSPGIGGGGGSMLYLPLQQPPQHQMRIIQNQHHHQDPYTAYEWASTQHFIDPHQQQHVLYQDPTAAQAREDTGGGYQILNPYGTTTGVRARLNYSPDILLPPGGQSTPLQHHNNLLSSSLDDILSKFPLVPLSAAGDAAADAESQKIILPFSQQQRQQSPQEEHNNPTPQTIKRNYFQTTFV